MKIKQDQLRDFSFPKNVEEVLMNKGLPNKKILQLEFFNTFKRLDNPNNMVQIGVESEENKVCLDERSGEIYLFNESGSVGLLNSSLDALLSSLSCFERVQLEISKRANANGFLDDNVNSEIVSAFEKELLSIDSAVKNTDIFWSVIVEQLEDQMM